MTVIRFELIGRPQPQGSHRSVRHSKTGRPITLDDNPNLGVWRDELARVALAARIAASIPDVLIGPVRVDATFLFTRPRSHYGTGRNAARVKDSAAAYPAVRPDVDKLSRAVLDALTGTVIRDDGQVVELEPRKMYGEPAMVTVTVRELRRTVV